MKNEEKNIDKTIADVEGKADEQQQLVESNAADDLDNHVWPRGRAAQLGAPPHRSARPAAAPFWNAFPPLEG